MHTLLFKESPILAFVSVLSMIVMYPFVNLFFLAVVSFLFLAYFYRYTPHTLRYDDNTLVSPSQGKVIAVKRENGLYYVAIFLSPFNKHTQIYPINGTVVNRTYDHTGRFDIVMDINKSRWNEKKIHTIIANNKRKIQMYQIAGFLPRMITSSEETPMTVQAGEYLGMMKFGSRVDLIFSDDCELLVRHGQNVEIGDVICRFQ